MLKHVQKGQPLKIAAADWNKIIDATRAQLEANPRKRRMANSAGTRYSEGGVVLVKNASGQDQPQFAVLGIDAPIIPPAPAPEGNLDEFKRQVALSCVTPTADHARRFVVLQEPLPSGGIGRACVSGVTHVRIKVENEDVTTAGIAEEESSWLQSGSGNACDILWKEDADQSDGTRWAIVRIGGGSHAIFPARIISADNGAHAWNEVQATGGGGFTSGGTSGGASGGGRSGTTTENAAYEINGRTNVPANTMVWMMPVTSGDGSTSYLFDLGMGNIGSPLGMTYTGEHGENASPAAWDINDQDETRGVSLTVQTGSRFDHNAASPVLYAYLRNLTFDANGHLIAVGPESRVVIDSPEACP